MKPIHTVQTTLGDLIVALTEETLKAVPDPRQAYRIVATKLAAIPVNRANLSAAATQPTNLSISLINTFARSACLIFALTLAACTSTFEPRIIAGALEPPRLPTAKETRAGVEVSIEEYFSSHKARRAFDADVAANGVLPVLVHIENKSPIDYRVERGSIRATLDGEALTDLYGIDAADAGALRNPAWNALVNTAAMGPLAIFFGIGAMAGTASQTQKINRQIEQHFESVELTDRIIKAAERATGFVFFRMPAGKTSLESITLDVKLTGEPVEGYPTRALSYQLALKPR